MADLLVVRPAAPPEHEAARALLAAAGGAYARRLLELLERATPGPDAEYQAYVAVERPTRREEHIVGVLLAERVAGAVGTVRIHAVAGQADDTRDAAGVQQRLIAEAAAHARRDGARLLLAELPEEPSIRAMREALLAASFVEEGRIPDLFRGGVALVLLRLDL